MRFNPDIHHRQSVRLKGYDFSKGGAYFVTVCTRDREHYFGSVKDNRVILSNEGEIVFSALEESLEIRKEIHIDTVLIMPNHIHLIVFIVGANGCLPLPGEISRSRAKCPSPLRMQRDSLSSFMSGYKSSVSRQVGFSIWQRNYYEHIIQNTRELTAYRKYIKNNPAKWEEDEYFG